MICKTLSFSFVFLLKLAMAWQCHAQQVEYARKVIATLCSDSMRGRGYVGNGDRNAAEYLASEFEKAGLKKYNKTYFQTFTTPVNSFPGNMSLTVNGTILKPGEDFLIDPSSPGVSGSFQVQMLTTEDLLNNGWLQKIKEASSKFVCIEVFDKTKFSADEQKRLNEIISFIKYGKDNPAKGTLVLTTEKLTWSVATELFYKPAFTVNSKSISQPITTLEISVENKFLKDHRTQNVIGYLEGSRSDSLVVFTAHYDHLGMMGRETIFPGANDNASGVSMLLNMMRHFSNTKPNYNTVFIAFAAEELGLIGSSYFTSHPLFPLNQIKFLINFDLAGTGDDGIQVVNGKIYQQKFDMMVRLNEQDKLLKQVKIRGEACNSDHCTFYAKGVPCFYIYTLGGIQAYHDIYDRAETLPLTDYKDYFALLIKFVETL
jgi:aminopeptidase YwaD